MRPRVAAEGPLLTLGIAGHVDHGKTALVRALTGIETDRLAEEQRRGISIELGFAWMDLAQAGGSVQRVGLIDMPGHERFVRRMISGTSGIDAVLLCVAADEGVMPQGREHLAICQLLGVRRGAIVLTKTDLADAMLVDLVREDLAALTAGTFLQDAPVWPVSVHQPETIAGLREALAAWCQTLDPASALPESQGRPFRMAVDRSFSLAGRGTIVAGTAAQGVVRAEQTLEVLPSGATFRVRSIEQHGRGVAQAAAPGRVALNLAGASLDEVPVGAVLAEPGTLPCTDRFDASLSLLEQGTKPLPVRRRAMVHIGTTQVQGAIVQLSGQPQAPGTVAFVQIHLDTPLPIGAGERFVVRASRVDPRHGATLAGGVVLHPAPRRHRLGDAELSLQLACLADPGTEGQVLALITLAGIRGETDASLAVRAAAGPAAIAKALKGLLASGRVRRAGNPARYLSLGAVAELEQSVLRAVERYHARHPAKAGLEPDQLHHLAGTWLDAATLAQVAAALRKRGALADAAGCLALPGFAPRATIAPETVRALVEAIESEALAPQPTSTHGAALGLSPRDLAATLQVALAGRDLVRLGEDLHVAAPAALKAIDQVLEAFADQASFSTGALKDLLGLTRKHLIPFAEYLDAERITVRDPSGNRRVRDRARQAWLDRK